MTETADTIIPFFTGNYAPVADELTAFDLPVQGSIPPELNGWYLRNGPNSRVVDPVTGSPAMAWCTACGWKTAEPPGIATAGCAPRASSIRSRSTTRMAHATCTRASPTRT